MAIPTTRAQFKEYCLRRLGSPVIDINVSPEQIEDRIDDALLYYMDYHHDGSQRMLYRHQVVAEDITNGYIPVPEHIISIVDLFSLISSATGSYGMFGAQYQMHLNEAFTRVNQPLLPYYTAKLHLANLDEMFNGEQHFRYNRHVNRMYIDMDWQEKTAVGQYILIECYQKVDPDEYTDVWGDRWLQRYCTTMIKQQWGSNLIKFEGLQLPGGVTFNGAKTYDDATAELLRLEEEMINSYSSPLMTFIG